MNKIILIPDRIKNNTEIEDKVFGKGYQIITQNKNDAKQIPDDIWQSADAILAWHEINYDADLTIVDLKKEVKITNDIMANKSGWTPFHNKSVKGWPIMTIVNGNTVMRDGELIGEPSGKAIIFNRE